MDSDVAWFVGSGYIPVLMWCCGYPYPWSMGPVYSAVSKWLPANQPVPNEQQNIKMCKNCCKTKCILHSISSAPPNVQE
jgi:ABC-type multidrug transport system permease subunit